MKLKKTVGARAHLYPIMDIDENQLMASQTNIEIYADEIIQRNEEPITNPKDTIPHDQVQSSMHYLNNHQTPRLATMNEDDLIDGTVKSKFNRQITGKMGSDLNIFD